MFLGLVEVEVRIGTLSKEKSPCGNVFFTLFPKMHNKRGW